MQTCILNEPCTQLKCLGSNYGVLLSRETMDGSIEPGPKNTFKQNQTGSAVELSDEVEGIVSRTKGSYQEHDSVGPVAIVYFVHLCHGSDTQLFKH